MNSMWWPPNRTLGGILHQTVFLVFSALSAFNYVMATLCGPGFLPPKWRPKVNYYANIYIRYLFRFFFISTALKASRTLFHAISINTTVCEQKMRSPGQFFPNQTQCFRFFSNLSDRKVPMKTKTIFLVSQQ